MSDDGDLLSAALDYVARGWAVFPCKPRAKVPATIDGFKSATTDADTVREWWRRWPEANVAIRTGAESDLVVLDVDVQHGGAGTLAELERERGKLPKTPRVLTGGGGQHVYFRHPGDEVRNSAGRLGPGLDVRGDGGYVVAPPSVHENGRDYKWLIAPERPSELLTWLVADARERRNGAAPPVGEVIPSGQRNAGLASLAGTMRRRGMDEAAILAALKVTNRERCKPPLAERDVERIAASIAGYPSLETTEKPFALAAVTARDLCELPDPPESDELLGPLVVRGSRVVLGGHTGEGKTTLTLQIARAIVLADEFLGWTGSGGVRALVIDAEQGLKTIKRRLREAGLGESELVDYVRVPDGLELDSDERHVAEVERLLMDGDYALVCADPLYKLHTGDSNAEREAVDLMRRFDGWRERFGFALLLPVHCRKPVPGMKFSIHDLFGSSAYVRGAEVVLGLRRVSDGYAKLHFLKDRDGDLPIGVAWSLLFDQETGFHRDPNDGVVRDLREELLELLADGEWWTPNDLRKPKDEGGVGADRDKVKSELDAMTGEGLIEFERGPEGRRKDAKCYHRIWRETSDATYASSPENSPGGEAKGRCGVVASPKGDDTTDATSTDTERDAAELAWE